MAETSPFRVIGQVNRVDVANAAPRYVLLSADGREPQEVCLARREGDRFLSVSGPFTLDQVQELAGNVLAGAPLARTDPEAMNALALFVSTFCLLYRRNVAAADETSGAADHAPESPAPEPAPPACDCTPHARAVPTHESHFACTPCGG